MNQTPPATTSARRRETRARLLDAATEVFAAEGLQGASVEAVCSQAGFTRGAFYSNFESKEQLFLEMIEREFQHRAEHIETQAVPLTRMLREHGTQLTQAKAAHYIADFFAPEEDAVTWIRLETELLMLAMREPGIGARYREFIEGFYLGISEVVEGIVAGAGRRFTIPVDHALPMITNVYEAALRTAAIEGITSGGPIDEIDDRLSALLFALTEPAPRTA